MILYAQRGAYSPKMLINKVIKLLITIYSETFTHGAMGRRIDPSCAGPIELFLVPASAPRLV